MPISSILSAACSCVEGSLISRLQSYSKIRRNRSTACWPRQLGERQSKKSKRSHRMREQDDALLLKDCRGGCIWTGRNRDAVAAQLETTRAAEISALQEKIRQVCDPTAHETTTLGLAAAAWWTCVASYMANRCRAPTSWWRTP